VPNGTRFTGVASYRNMSSGSTVRSLMRSLSLSFSLSQSNDLYPPHPTPDPSPGWVPHRPQSSYQTWLMPFDTVYNRWTVGLQGSGIRPILLVMIVWLQTAGYLKIPSEVPGYDDDVSRLCPQNNLEHLLNSRWPCSAISTAPATIQNKMTIN